MQTAGTRLSLPGFPIQSSMRDLKLLPQCWVPTNAMRSEYFSRRLVLQVLGPPSVFPVAEAPVLRPLP